MPHIPWCDIYNNISENGRKVHRIVGNGLCLVEAVQVTIDKDLGIKNSYNVQANKNLSEIKNRKSGFTKILQWGKVQHLF